MERLTLILAFLVCCGAASAAEAPREVVRSFYGALLHPSPQLRAQPEFDRVKHFLSTNLVRALRAQHKYESACAQITAPGVKPYMVDQSLFFLAPDGAKTIGHLEQAVSGDRAHVVAHLAYDDIVWQDTARLKREDGRWMIADISWVDGGSLVRRLQEFAAQSCAPNNSSKPTPRRGAA